MASSQPSAGSPARGAPIQVLVEPGGDGIAVDWEATINSPELREAGPIES